MTENKRYNLRAGYYHNYTGIGRNKEENLTTNKVCDKLNSLIDENEQLKDELFDVTTSLIYETSSNINEDIEEARKEIYGDSE